MTVIDSHLHWYPRDIVEVLRQRHGVHLPLSDVWMDLDGHLTRMQSIGTDVGLVASAGVVSEFFSQMDPSEGAELVAQYNEAMAAAQNKHAGRFWGTSVVALHDTDDAIATVDRSVGDLGLRAGVCLPAAVGGGENLDTARLEPLYARIEELGIPIFLHPTDSPFEQAFAGYEGALQLSLGRIVDVSVAAFRLVLSGIMERHPNLKVFMSHTGGALPYQAARLDKNVRLDSLPAPPSSYIKRMYTDTVSPHAMGVKFAVDFFGPDHVLYGSDFPCWDPDAAVEVLDQAGIGAEAVRKVRSENAKRLFSLDPSASVAA